MKKALLMLLPFGALLLGLSTPASALVVVIGNRLAHDCYEMAKSGVDPLNGIATCNSALENESLDTHDRAGTYVNRGAIKMAVNRIADAMDDYNAGITIMPGMADAYVDRAGAFIQQHKYDQALDDVNHGLQLGPTAPFVGYYNRAVVEQLTGHLKEAYLDYQKTLELEPKFLPAAERLKDFVVTKKDGTPVDPGNN